MWRAECCRPTATRPTPAPRATPPRTAASRWRSLRTGQSSAGNTRWTGSIETSTRLFLLSGFTELHVWLRTHVLLSRCQLLWLNVQKSTGLNPFNLNLLYKINFRTQVCLDSMPWTLWRTYPTLTCLVQSFPLQPRKAWDTKKKHFRLLKMYSHIYNQHQRRNKHQQFMQIKQKWDLFICITFFVFQCRMS